MKETKLYQTITSSRWGKAVLVGLGTIFLGALGSGLWDVFLRDFLNLLAFSLLKVIGSVYSGYLDSLHADIADGCVDRFSTLPHMIIVVFVCMFPWMAIWQLRRKARSYEAKYATPTQPHDTKTADEKVADTKKTVLKFTIIMSIFAVFITITYLVYAARVEYASRGAVYLDRSIDIIAPHIPATDVLRFRAAFRSIKTTVDFHKLDSELKEIAEKAKVELPKFRSLGK